MLWRYRIAGWVIAVALAAAAPTIYLIHPTSLVWWLAPFLALPLLLAGRTRNADDIHMGASMMARGQRPNLARKSLCGRAGTAVRSPLS
jgi:predicted secreted protein